VIVSPSPYTNKAYFKMLISLSELCSSLCFAEQVQMRKTLYDSLVFPFDPKIDDTNNTKRLTVHEEFSSSFA